MLHFISAGLSFNHPGRYLL